MKRKIAQLIIYLVIVQVAVILISWLLTSWMPTSTYQSLLSEEGVRWMFRSFPHAASTPLVSIALLWWVAVKMLNKSGYIALSAKRTEFFRRVTQTLLVCVAVVIVFLLLPSEGHMCRLLLSVTGGITSSPLIIALPYILPIILIVVAMVCGFSSRRWKTAADPFMSLSPATSLPSLLVAIIQIAWLVEMIVYVIS